MSYKNYVTGSHDFTINPSPAESRASGISIGRLNVWPPGSRDGNEVARLIDESGLDMVIVRSGAEDVELAARLQIPSLLSWQADTLLYFEIDTQIPTNFSQGMSFQSLTRSDEASVNELIRHIFTGYQNHYSGNPNLRGINVVTAYQEWAVANLGNGESSVLRANLAGRDNAGLIVIDEANDLYNEVLLAGVVPEYRRQGLYSEMIRHVITHSRNSGKQSVVISTQVANIGVMRAWCRLGFVPVRAINTIHVMRRELIETLPI